MKLFGWKSAGRGSLRPVQTRARGPQASLDRPFWARSGAVSLGTWPTGYEAQLREGYLHNAIAQRAVRLVAEGVASVPLTSPDPGVLALVKATSGGQHLLETVASHLLLHGNAYIELIAGPDGTPVELYALRPERVAVEADTRGWPMAFLYTAGPATTRMPAESVIHIRNMHPLDDHYGLGCLGAASGAVAIHNAAAKWNKALLDNAARPSGALTYDTGDAGALSGEQFDRLRAELDASFAGAVNAGRPMLLEGGLKWQALSMTPADMDFVGLKEGAAREIALAFGVPPVLLGLPGDATYANYREANKALWRQSILPLTVKILEALGEGLRPWFAGVSFGIDLDQVTALSEDRERLWTQVSAADFLTLDEKRAMAGFEPVKATDASPTKIENTKTDMIELKFNPWHDTQDGQFTSEGQGQSFGGGGSFGRSASTGSQSFAAAIKPKKPSSVKPGSGGIVSRSKTAPKASASGVNKTKPKTPKSENLATYFSAATKPTVENAIAQIKKSKFGKTKAGKFVVDKIERLHKDGKIVIADAFDNNGNRLRGKYDDSSGTLTVDTKFAAHVNDIASELVHEAAHSLLSAEYARTNRQPGGNSIEQETLTNGYQLQLYREQRKYRTDEELEKRLRASNNGKLRQNIRSRYAAAPENQPKIK